jgi:hypothetical protein
VAKPRLKLVGPAANVRYWQLSGHFQIVAQCPLSGAKRASAPLRRGWRNLITIRCFGIGGPKAA